MVQTAVVQSHLQTRNYIREDTELGAHMAPVQMPSSHPEEGRLPHRAQGKNSSKDSEVERWASAEEAEVLG